MVPHADRSLDSEDEELPEGLWIPSTQDDKDVVEEEVEEEESEEEDPELDLKDGQEVVGVVVQAPKTGRGASPTYTQVRGDVSLSP